MHRKAQPLNSIFGIAWNSVLALMLVLLVLIVVVLFMVLAAQPAQAQTYKVIYNLIDGTAGGDPWAGVTMDAAGNLYGTTSGFVNGPGTVYKLTPKGSAWVFTLLHGFGAPGDGSIPWMGVAFGPDGALYGTTYVGGASGNGTVFKLAAPTTPCRAVSCPWTESVLYSFTGGNDAEPLFGDLVFDPAGNIYGTAVGVTGAGGLVYQLTRTASGWTENVLHTFDGEAHPIGGVIFDDAGNLYGMTALGGPNSCGTVFKLTYSAGSGWTESVLYNFQGGNDGCEPFSGLIFDTSGSLYGATTWGGQGGGGTVFQLTPAGSGWNYTPVYSFPGNYSVCGPWGSLVMDRQGSLYGTTYCDGAEGAGNIFKLTPSGGGWAYTSLHDFSIDRHDGANPIGNVILDSQGNLYGTTSSGGTGCRYNNCGVVWEITP